MYYMYDCICMKGGQLKDGHGTTGHTLLRKSEGGAC